MSHGKTVGLRKLAHSSSNYGFTTFQPELVGAAPKPFEHGVNAYRSGKCRCREVCLPAHNARTAEVKAAKANGTWQPKRKNAVSAEADAFALSLLKDGATYREAATSAGVDQHQLAKRHPEFKANRNEFATVMAQIRRVPKLLELHREIWQKGEAA